MKKLFGIVLVSLALLVQLAVAHQMALKYDPSTGKCTTIVYIDGQPIEITVPCPTSITQGKA